jgi:TraM recognition site of TraD and TraG
MTQLEQAYGKETSRAILSGCNTKFIFNPGEYESAKYFSDYLGDEEVKYKQKSRSNSKDGGSNSVSEQDKTKKMFSPEEILKLPAGSCIFINPAYANQTEASIPMKLKVHVGDGEMQRRAYGETNFDRVIKQLKIKNKHSPITGSDITERINSLNKFIPGKYAKSLKLMCSDASKHLVENNPLFMKK